MGGSRRRFPHSFLMASRTETDRCLGNRLCASCKQKNPSLSCYEHIHIYNAWMRNVGKADIATKHVLFFLLAFLETKVDGRIGEEKRDIKGGLHITTICLAWGCHLSLMIPGSPFIWSVTPFLLAI